MAGRTAGPGQQGLPRQHPPPPPGRTCGIGAESLPATSGLFSVLPFQNKSRSGDWACLSLPVTHLSVWLSSGCLSARNSGGTLSSQLGSPWGGLGRLQVGARGACMRQGCVCAPGVCGCVCVWGGVWGVGVHVCVWGCIHPISSRPWGSLGKTAGQWNRRGDLRVSLSRLRGSEGGAGGSRSPLSTVSESLPHPAGELVSGGGRLLTPPLPPPQKRVGGLKEKPQNTP